MWVFWVVNFEIVVIICAVNVFCCRMGNESCKDVNEICSPIICPRTEKGRKQRSLCIKSELDGSPLRTSSVCTGDTPRVCVGKVEKLRSNREKASVFSPIAPRFSEYHAAFLRNVSLYGRKTGNAGRKWGKEGNILRSLRDEMNGRVCTNPQARTRKKQSPRSGRLCFEKKRGSCSIGIRGRARLTQQRGFETGAGRFAPGV